MSDQSNNVNLKLVVNNETPQIEKGYVRIANELLEAILLYPFTKRQHVVLLAIIRKTYGYNKKEDAISLSQICALTGLDKANVSKTISELVEMSVIVRADDNGKNVIGVQKNYTLWKGVVKTTTPKNDAGGCQFDHQKVVNLTTKGVVNLTTTKDINTKTKDNKEPVVSDDLSLSVKKTRKKKPEIPIQDFLDQCKLTGEKAIPDTDPIFDYAEKIKIPFGLLHAYWLEFVERHKETDKLQKCWRSTFRNYVRNNWYKFWYISDNGLTISSNGRQACLKHGIEVSV